MTACLFVNLRICLEREWKRKENEGLENKTRTMIPVGNVYMSPSPALAESEIRGSRPRPTLKTNPPSRSAVIPVPHHQPRRSLNPYYTAYSSPSPLVPSSRPPPYTEHPYPRNDSFCSEYPYADVWPAASCACFVCSSFNSNPYLQCGSICPNPLFSLATAARLRASPPSYTPTPSAQHRTVSSTPSTLSSPPNLHPAFPDQKDSVLHPRVAVLLGVEKHWHLPLLFCRALSVAPAAWWGLRCALTFMGELLLDEEGVEGQWSVERRFRVTEVFLAVLWCLCSGYLSFYFTDCLMSRWLLNYSPPATLVRLFTTNSLNAYITSWVLYLSGGSQDPRLLLPAWISIASTLTILYHLTHPRLAILKETSLSISVFSIASFISMVSLLLQLHLTRANDPPVPLFGILKYAWLWTKMGVGWFGDIARVGHEV